MSVPGIAESDLRDDQAEAHLTSTCTEGTHDRRGSSCVGTVAHVVKMALSSARATSMTVITPSICRSRLMTGSEMPMQRGRGGGAGELVRHRGVEGNDRNKAGDSDGHANIASTTSCCIAPPI